ncbi:hypothetical protein SAMN05720764_1412 [Fibrobacter sp. UWH5]|nr:hypothetical protein SAMN05720764_1412 [Fibrobacter sp. UWH5]
MSIAVAPGRRRGHRPPYMGAASAHRTSRRQAQAISCRRRLTGKGVPCRRPFRLSPGLRGLPDEYPSKKCFCFYLYVYETSFYAKRFYYHYCYLGCILCDYFA